MPLIEPSPMQSFSLANDTVTVYLLHVQPYTYFDVQTFSLDSTQIDSYYNYPVTPHHDNLSAVNLSGAFQFDYPYPNSSSSPFVEDSATASASLVLSDGRRSQLLASGWPQHLPDPEVTRHL
jgi:hypothetical protein